jgi:hypothetical protein
MVSHARIEAYEEQMPTVIAKVVKGVIATRYRILKCECDAIQFSVGDAHAPDEVLDIGDVLLVRFGREDNEGAPCAAAFFDPIVV